LADVYEIGVVLPTVTTAFVLKVPVIDMVTTFPKTVGAAMVPVPAVSAAFGGVVLKLADRLPGMAIFSVFPAVSALLPLAEMVITG
jgi:hypothetical protein